MGQFDVYKHSAGTSFSLLLDIQADELARIDGRVVVPMVARKRYGAKPIPRLNPLATIGATEYVLLFHDLAAVPKNVLGERVGSLAQRRTDLVAALDLLFTGV
jgi:toxin CcdB